MAIIIWYVKESIHRDYGPKKKIADTFLHSPTEIYQQFEHNEQATE